MSGKGIMGRFTEIPDSEDELFTSSPGAPPHGYVSQFDGTADARPLDASSLGGGSPELLAGTAVNPPTEHPAKTCNDEQSVVLDGSHSLHAVAPASSDSGILEPMVNELGVPYRNASSLTDSCDSSNHLASALTDLPPLHNLNKQEYAAEVTSEDGDKEQSPPAEENVSSPMDEMLYRASSPTSANRDSIATNNKLLDLDGQPLLPPVEDDTDPVYSEAVPTVSTVEDGLPDTMHTGQELIGARSGDGDHPEQKTQYGEPECTGPPELLKSTNEDRIQPSVSSANGSNVSPHDITMEHINQDSSTTPAPPSPARITLGNGRHRSAKAGRSSRSCRNRLEKA
jgi:hypothetical protein